MRATHQNCHNDWSGGTDNSNVNDDRATTIAMWTRCQLLTDSEQLKPQQPTWKTRRHQPQKPPRTTNRNWSIRQTCPNHSINIDVIQSWPEPEPKKVACNITIPVKHVSINWVYNVKICLSQKNVVYNVKIYVIKPKKWGLQRQNLCKPKKWRLQRQNLRKQQKIGVYVKNYVNKKLGFTTSKFT